MALFLMLEEKAHSKKTHPINAHSKRCPLLANFIDWVK
jgi:hypothetical protein